MKYRYIPNLITVLRILLVAPIIGLLLLDRYTDALLLLFIAGVSDGLDGFLAKHYGWTSELGGMLDPLADKFLLIGVFLALGWMGDLPIWLIAMVIIRDLVIVSGAISYHYLIGPFQAAPLLISKINTVIQLLLVLTVVFARGVLALPDWVLHGLIYLTAVTTLLSGVAYVWEWGLRALPKGRNI